jgi:hypothetical protein
MWINLVSRKYDPCIVLLVYIYSRLPWWLQKKNLLNRATVFFHAQYVVLKFLSFFQHSKLEKGWPITLILGRVIGDASK